MKFDRQSAPIASYTNAIELIAFSRSISSKSRRRMKILYLRGSPYCLHLRES